MEENIQTAPTEKVASTAGSAPIILKIHIKIRFKKRYPKNSRLLSILSYHLIAKAILQLTIFQGGGGGEGADLRAVSHATDGQEFLGGLKE